MRTTVFVLIILTVMVLGLAACGERTTSEKVSDAAKAVGDDIEEAAEDVGDAAVDVAHDVEDSVKDATN